MFFGGRLTRLSFILALAFGTPLLSATVTLPWMIAHAAMVRVPVDVRLKSPVTVEGPVIYLGDLADIDGADDELREKLERLEVGRSALPGTSRTITVGTITLRVRQARLADLDIVFHREDDRIEVITASQTVRGTTIEEIVRRWYDDYLEIPEDGHLYLDVTSDDVVVGVGRVDVRRVAGTIGWGRNLLTLDILVDGQSAKRLQVSATATVEQSVYVARRNVSRGEVVREADVELRRLRLDQPASLFEPATVRMTRSAREGTPLTWAFVELIPPVTRGERVMVEAGLGGVLVQIVGVAQADGWPGDEILVRNEKTDVIFPARVIAAQKVRAAY